MPTAQMISTVEQYTGGWNSLNLDSLMDSLSDNIDFHDLAVDKHFTSKDEIRAHNGEIFRSVADVNMTVVSNSGNETDFCCTEWTMSFRYVNQSPLLPIPAQGQEIKMLGVALNWFDDKGKIVKARHYGRFLLPPPEQ